MPKRHGPESMQGGGGSHYTGANVEGAGAQPGSGGSITKDHAGRKKSATTDKHAGSQNERPNKKAA